jgi:hypothetical protein
MRCSGLALLLGVPWRIDTVVKFQRNVVGNGIVEDFVDDRRESKSLPISVPIRALQETNSR